MLIFEGFIGEGASNVSGVIENMDFRGFRRYVFSTINKFFRKAHRRGLVTTLFDIQGLIDKHDTHLCRSIAYTHHCLHYLLPEKLNRSMNLRHRGHEYTLSHITTTQLKNIPLSLDVYLAWSSSLCFIVCLFYTSH